MKAYYTTQQWKTEKEKLGPISRQIKICVAYELDGSRIDYFPSQIDELRRVKPIYETLPGWERDITGIRALNDLPQNARRYLDRISELLGCPVAIVSVGPDREQTMFTPQFVATI